MAPHTEIPEIEPDELGTRLRGGDEHMILIDVREPEENDLVAIKPCTLIPLMEIPARLEEFRTLSQNGRNELIIYCHHGQRSAMATDFLMAQSIQNVKNLRGGIDAYAKKVDPSLPLY